MNPADLEKQLLATTVAHHRQGLRWHLANLLEILDVDLAVSPHDLDLDDLLRDLRLWRAAADLLDEAEEGGAL